MDGQGTKTKSIAARGTWFAVKLSAFAVCVCALLYVIWGQLSSLGNVEAQIAFVKADMAQEEMLKAELLRQQDCIESDAVIIKLARERLGMVGKDEIKYIITR